MKSYCVRVGLSVAVVAAGCGGASDFGEGEVVPAGPAVDVPGYPVASRFWAEVNPTQGTMLLYPLHAGNVIYRNEVTLPVYYEYNVAAPTYGKCPGGAGCPAGELGLWTDQNQVSFKDLSGVCHSNNRIVDCGTLGTTCNQTNRFCGSVQILDNGYGHALPDLVLLISNQQNVGNPIQGCVDDGVGSFGQCSSPAAPAANVAKVSGASTDLQSPIVTLAGAAGYCTYCYGNAHDSTVVAQPGLRDAVLAGAFSASNTFYKDTIAFDLLDSTAFGLTLTVRNASPSIDTSPFVWTNRGAYNCVRPGTTTVQVSGGGFGPNAGCTGTSSCPASGGAAAGSQLLFTQQGGGTVGATVSTWSDTSVAATSPATNVGPGSIYVSTPVGTSPASIETYELCTGSFLVSVVPTAVYQSGDTNPAHTTQFTLTVTAKDAAGNTTTKYQGTVNITLTGGPSNNPAHLLNVQNPYTFTSGDGGVKQWTTAQIDKSWPQPYTITATDSVTSTITGAATVVICNNTAKTCP